MINYGNIGTILVEEKNKMDRKDKVDQLKNLLQKIQNSIELYNSKVDVSEQVELHSKQPVNPIIPNTGDYAICLVRTFTKNDEASELKVELFQKEMISGGDSGHFNMTYVYRGFHSDLVGVSSLSQGAYDIDINCHILSEVNFEGMRIMAFLDKKITSYTLGIVGTNQEIASVLDYANMYYADKMKEYSKSQKEKIKN